jgi:hypothetical protein
MSEEDLASALSSEGMAGIDSNRYKELLRSEEILNALYNGGVDNWEWYDESLSELGDAE